MHGISVSLGALLGVLTMAPTLALSYLAQRLAGLPFLPFELFDWLARVLPGNVVTLGIDTIVFLIRATGGSTSGAAKLVEQLLAVLLMLALGAIAGAIIVLLLRHTDRVGWRLGLTAGLLLLLLFTFVEYSLGLAGSPLLILGGFGLLLGGWGAILGAMLAHLEQPGQTSEERRSFVLRAGASALALALGSWAVGRLLAERTMAEGAGQPLAADPTGSMAPAPPPTPQNRIQPAPGTRQELTGNDEFYRIDINTRPPVIDGNTWHLEVAGLFENARPLSLDALMAYEAVTQPITLSCISNRIAGDLIGTSYWTGVRLRDVLEDLGLQPEAGALFLGARDGFYETVVAEDMMNEHTLLVYAMNGETLPVEHGFPLRIYIPNRYGMKQPKWIVRMEAVEAWAPGYWVERGWSREARPHTVSVIDTVAEKSAPDGIVPVGGIAWAGDRGIEKVEIQVDDGPWLEAELRTPPLSGLTWVQWRYDWAASEGRHTLTVRATDGEGNLQTAEQSGVRPDGATGYHSVSTRI